MRTAEDQIYLVGGGIASLAAAVFLIRDANCDGADIHILEGSAVLGGSLDGAGNPSSGYVIRGGRMFEEHFVCTFGLLDGIPVLSDQNRSVTEEIKAFTRQVVTSSSCRLVVDGKRLEAPGFGLSARDRWDLVALSLIPERALESTTISEYFSSGFFSTHFWTMWCTMFAFQPWHSVAEMRRYMRRFMHLLPGFNRLEGIYRTRLNQYDSIVRPIESWLRARNVQFHLDAPVTDVQLDDDAEHIKGLAWLSAGSPMIQPISPNGKVFLTLGSMTEGSRLGSMRDPPVFDPDVPDGSWHLWRRIADASPRFGDPDRFAGDTARTVWSSFTATLHHPSFFEHMEAFTGNAAGTGGLVTFANSGWLMSVVLAHQPHFANQDPETFVFWGYGLHPHQRGDAVSKPMLDCSGSEILTELAHQLDLGARANEMFRDAICIPCALPFITAQFMPRTRGDRPPVVPKPNGNFAFIGQFCEIPEDTVFTVEYSVRSAQLAVYALLGLERTPPPIYRGYSKPGVIGPAMRTLLRNGR